MNYLESKSFEAVNGFVHNPDVEFEELQTACLDLATELEKYNIKKSDLNIAVNKYCQCEYAKSYIVLTYEDYYVYDKEYFLKNTPYWIVRGSVMAKGHFPKDSRVCEIHFCPSCGEKLSPVRMKEVLPEKVVTIEDGGFYCSTCGERLNVCECARPHEMWEAAC